jgi:hypothetical protein
MNYFLFCKLSRDSSFIPLFLTIGFFFCYNANENTCNITVYTMFILDITPAFLFDDNES